MATYVAIPKDEMVAFLTKLGFQPVKIDGTYKLVMAKLVLVGNHKLSLRIYTTCSDDIARGVGVDAIRTKLYFRDKKGAIHHVASCKRVHRVKGWKKNLQSRIENWTNEVRVCVSCGLPMIKRKRRTDGSKFWGCLGFQLETGCKRTERVD